MHHLETLIQSIPTNILDAARAGTLPSLLASSANASNSLQVPLGGKVASSPEPSASSAMAPASSPLPPVPSFTLSNPAVHFAPEGTTMPFSGTSTPPSPRPLSHSYMYWDEQGCKRWQGETSGLPLLDALFDLSCGSPPGAQHDWGKRSESPIPDEDVTGASTPSSGHEQMHASDSKAEWFPGRVPKGIDAFNPETLWKVITAVVAPDLMDT